MAKLNTALLKQEIVKHIANNPGCIKNLFDPADQHLIDETRLQNVNFWKRYHKEKTNSGIDRGFNCTDPLQDLVSDQVTAQILTSFDDMTILSLTIEG